MPEAVDITTDSNWRPYLATCAAESKARTNSSMYGVHVGSRGPDRVLSSP
jgi:hypothetical protein